MSVDNVDMTGWTDEQVDEYVRKQYGPLDEPNGVLKEIPRGMDLMHKLMGDSIEENQKKKEKEKARAESAKQVPDIVIAASLCNAEAIKEMLEAGEDVNKPAPKVEGGWQALHSACFAYRRGAPVPVVLETVEVLLNGGANIHGTLPTGSTPLHVACEVGCRDVAKRLLAAGAEIDAMTEDGTMPMTVCSQMGHLECMRVLIEGRAEVDKPRKGGVTSLHIACNASQHECVALLLKSGANPDSSIEGTKQTALHLSCMENRAKCVKMLIEGNAHVDLETSGGATPLHVACEHDCAGCAQLLLNGKAQVDPQCKMDDGRLRLTPLYAAARRGFDGCVQVCLKAGADVNRHNGHLGTALYAAVCAGAPSTLRILLRAGADPSSRSGSTRPDYAGGASAGDAASSPLFAACHSKVHKELDKSKKGDLIECAKVLLEAGADVEAQTIDGRTALHAAAVLGYLPLVQLLVEAGAQLSVRTAEGLTALGLAQEHLARKTSDHGGHREIVSLLINKMAPLLKQKVQAHGLAGRPELNGQVGEAVLFDEKSGRYGVAFPGEVSVKLLPKNLERYTEPVAVD